MPGLTPRESEVLSLLSAGCAYREIAEALYISSETVHSHCKRIYRKLGITGRRQLNATEVSHPPDRPRDSASPSDITHFTQKLSNWGPQVTLFVSKVHPLRL
jgi:DNA-binding CsgD family transcriptional regulator